jgi:malonyl-ACP decarboxylase
MREFAITGVGVTSAIGQGRREFTAGLLSGKHAFAVMRRPGRQHGTSFLGAEIDSLPEPRQATARLMRNASLSAHAAILTLDEAWTDAQLDGVDPQRIGLVIGGSNLQQREIVQLHENYRARLEFLSPKYGLTFLDTDLCGICSEALGVRGPVHCVAGASASGHLAILQAIQAIQTGQVDVCIALGALLDISYWECQALRSLGAMGSSRYAATPGLACRPFDVNRDGFIYGECSGAVVVERADLPLRSGIQPYGFILGWATVIDGRRGPEPSYDGEVAVIDRALDHADLATRQIDYVNPHGSGSQLGDETELRALRACGLNEARINATKSLTGHGLSASGTVEVIATLLQMEAGWLHPSRNLEEPIDASFNWVRQRAVECDIRHALTLSFGFGGINTAICLARGVRSKEVPRGNDGWN